MIVYICSAYRAGTSRELKAHLDYAKELTRKVLLEGMVPVTCHLSIAEVLDDTDPGERNLGLKADLALLAKYDTVLVGQRFGISDGMAGEIGEAIRLGIPLVYTD